MSPPSETSAELPSDTPPDARPDSSRHADVKAVFFAVCDLTGDARAAALATACRGDDELEREVQSLLAHDSGPLAQAGGVGQSDRHADPAAAHAGTETQSATDDGARHPPSRRIGEYEILSVLGEGGMGVVYLARQRSPRRDVALKVLRAGSLRTADVRRFELEAELLGRMRHPGIASIYEAGTHRAGTGVQPFFAMEYIEGRDLAAHVEGADLSVSDRLELFVSVCDAVQSAHDLGIIHRDIKPANVLVDEAGRPHVIDFGIARVLGELDGLDAQQTRTGLLIGTPQYISPEQLQGQPVDGRADVYALGLILYELLVGQRPYELAGCSTADILRIVCDEPVTPPGRIRKRLRGDLEAMLTTALEKDPSLRYATVRDLAADVRRHLRGEPVLARATPLAVRAGKWLRRHPTKGLLVGLVGVVLLIGIGILAQRLLELRSEAVAASEAWMAGDLGVAREHLKQVPNWAEGMLLSGELAGFSGSVRALSGEQPEIGVLRALLNGSLGEARTLAGRYLVRDGIPVRGRLAAFLLQSLEEPVTPAGQDLRDWLVLVSRVFFERPVESPAALAASTGFRARFHELLRMPALSATTRLFILTGLAGCGDLDSAQLLVEHLKLAAKSAQREADALLAEEVRLSLRALEWIVRRSSSCGYSEALSKLDDSVLLDLRSAAERSIPTPNHSNRNRIVQELFGCVAFMRDSEGRSTNTIPAICFDDRQILEKTLLHRGPPTEPGLPESLVDINNAFVRFLERQPDLLPWKAAAISDYSYLLEAGNLLSKHPHLVQQLAQAAAGLSIDGDRFHAWFHAGTVAAEAEMGGIRDNQRPDAETRLDSWLTMDVVNERPAVTVSESDRRDALVQWDFTGHGVQAIGSPIDLQFAGVRTQLDEYTDLGRYAKLNPNGENRIMARFQWPGQVPLDAHGLVLRISAVKGLRRFLPHQGQAWLSVQLNGAHLLDAWLQTTRVQPIELPVQYQGLPGGEHQIELSLTTNSNTTARVRFVGLYWLLGSG